MNSQPSALQKSSDSRFDDPLVSEVRSARHALSSLFDNNLDRISEDLMNRQHALGRQLRAFSPNKEKSPGTT